MRSALIRASLAALVLVTAVATLAAAQGREASATQDSNLIVVTGERDRTKAVTRQTRQTTVATAEQIARFSDPVCVSVSGLEETANATVVRRIEAVATSAGLGVDAKGCRPNVIVALVPNGQRALAALVSERRNLFGGYSSAELRKLVRDDGPVHVMTMTQLRSRDGNAPGGGTPGGGQGINGTDIPTLVIDSVSLLGPPTRQDITGALVLIDEGATVGRTLRQLADYSAMRALAMTREPTDTGGGATILTLFSAGADAPRELTDFDRGYLRGIYHGPAMRWSQSWVGAISNGIRRGDRGKRVPAE